MTVKLLDKETKSLVDFEPNAVNAAVDSGKFLFPKNRGVPVRADGQLKYISAADAAKYRDRLLFVNDEDVERGQAEERFGGLGGAAQALAYGGVKGLTLGTVPALASALSPEFAEYSKQIELGRPGVTAAGEIASLAVDPFALAGKALRLGSKAAQETGAVAALGARAAGQAAPALGREALAGIEAAGARQVEDVAARQAAQRGVAARQPAVSLGEQTAMAGQVSPSILGRQALAPTAEEAATLAAEPGLRLGMDPYQTPELAMRARQAEELRLAGLSAREGEAARAADAASMERGLPPGAQGPVEDFGQMPGSAMEADYLKSELSRIDDALDANAAAASKARSPASRDRIGAERERLLAERERFDVDAMRTGMRADEDLAAQAERAYQATQFQAEAPGVAAQAAELGRRAQGLEAAQTVSPVLGRAATRVGAETAEGVRALGEAGTVARGAEFAPPLGRAAAAKTAAPWNLKGTEVGDLFKKWYYKNRTTWTDRLFEGGAISRESTDGFADAVAAGADQLQSHGMVKHSPSQAVNELINMLRSGLDPRRRGGELDTAPLATNARGLGAAIGTATGTSYRDGVFILVAKPGQALKGNLEGLGAVLINPELERLSVDTARNSRITEALRKEIQAVRPDLVVDTYDNAGRVTRQLLGAERAGAIGGTAVGEEVAAAARGAARGAEGLAPETLAGSFERMGGTLAEGPAAAAQAAQGGGLTLPTGLASMSAQGGLYGASEEARRQATGESQGGMGAILGAGALGAAIPAGLMLGGKVAAKGAQALATGAREAGLIERIAAGASTIEKQHIARSFDLSRDQVTRLNNKFAIPEIEQQGTDAFVKFIKGELDDVSKLKAAFPDDAFLQSIPENTSLKFGQLTPDRKKAFADAVERFYGKEYDTIFTDAVRAAPVDRAIIDRIIADTEARAVAGAPQRGLESVAPEIAAMRDYQGQHSVGTLRELQSRIGEIFRGRQGEGGKFTEAQAAMYGGLKRALADAVEAAEPGAAARLAENDVRYEMSKIMAEGANKVLSKATTTSPIGRDLLSQFALGFAAVGHPLAATKFFVTTVGLRHLYNTRGEGIIADMAGKLSTSLRKNPAAAATEAADIIVNARRPMLLGMSATKLTDAKPEDYTSMSRAVRELEATRDKAKRQIADATSGLTPEEQQKSVEFFDNQLNALASALPKGIPTGKALNEQEKNYTIFARAILDPQVYGVQAILDGGPGASVAADAINSLGPQGQEFLQKLGDNLQARISESEQLRGREDMLQTLRNVKTATRKSVGGGGGARLRALHPSSDVKNIAKGAPSAFQNAAKAFSGSAKGIQ